MVKKALSIALSLVLAAGLCPGAAVASGLQAQGTVAQTTTKVVKDRSCTIWKPDIEKNASSVKTGSTKLAVSKGGGYVKFRAPRTKTYKFTFSNVKAEQSGGFGGCVKVQQPSAKYPNEASFVKVAARGGKSHTLWLASNGYKATKTPLISRPLASRTAAIKMTKGAVAYFCIVNSYGKTTLNLKVS